MPPLLHSLRNTPLGELIVGTAHEAHPTDITAPLGARFAGRTILAIHVALDKAATVRVAFGKDGAPKLGGIRHIKQRSTTEFTEIVRAETLATHAEWAVIVMATGWQATLGQRAARPEPNETTFGFARHKLMFETPEVVVPRAQVDRVYTAIDHPSLDKSVVFSLKRRDVEQLCTEVRKCGLEIAAVRVAIAAQLELWLASQADGGLTRDLLLTDGLSALLLNTEQGDFAPPPGAIAAEQPRQAVQRPSAIEEDIARFITANSGRSVTFIGPEELCAAVKKQAPEVEIIRPPGNMAHDTQYAAVLPQVRHDLNFEAREVRPALPKSWRRIMLGYAAVAGALAVIAVVNSVYAVRAGYESYRLEKEAAQRVIDADSDAGASARILGDLADASALRSWVAANFHAQRFTYHLLKDVPANGALEKLTVELKDGQIALTFVALGDQETQLATHRAIEKAIKEIHFKIGGEDLPVNATASARAIQYRMHIIVPDAAEVAVE